MGELQEFFNQEPAVRFLERCSFSCLGELFLFYMWMKFSLRGCRSMRVPAYSPCELMQISSLSHEACVGLSAVLHGLTPPIGHSDTTAAIIEHHPPGLNTVKGAYSRLKQASSLMSHKVKVRRHCHDQCLDNAAHCRFVGRRSKQCTCVRCICARCKRCMCPLILPGITLVAARKPPKWVRVPCMATLKIPVPMLSTDRKAASAVWMIAYGVESWHRCTEHLRVK